MSHEKGIDMTSVLQVNTSCLLAGYDMYMYPSPVVKCNVQLKTDTHIYTFNKLSLGQANDINGAWMRNNRGSLFASKYLPYTPDSVIEHKDKIVLEKFY